MAYISVADLRAEGVTDPPYNDAYVTARIVLAQSLIEELTGRFFEKKEAYVVTLDGTGHDLLWLPVPPATIDSITKVEVGGDELDADDYELLMRAIPDGRFNPKLRRLSGFWPTGKSNIVITGDFGFVDPGETPTTPVNIKHLCKKIAVWGLPMVGDPEAQRGGRIIQESLGDYSYRLSEVGQRGFFGDSTIDGLLVMYKTKRIRGI